MSPGDLVAVALGLSAGAALSQRALTLFRRRTLRRLASSWRMNFSTGDQLKLAGRVARHFPIPGAANITVVDVIYGIDGDFYRYVFTAGYTVGVLRTKHRKLRVAAFAEPRDRRAPDLQEAVTLARGELPLLEQYHQFAPPRPAAWR